MLAGMEQEDSCQTETFTIWCFSFDPQNTNLMMYGSEDLKTI